MSIVNPYQNVFTASGTGGGTIGINTYYDANIPNPTTHRMFSTPIAESNPYKHDDVTLDMLTKLQVYTTSILAGDIKTVSQEYLHAMQLVVYILKRAKTPLDEKTLENIWTMTTAMEGNMVENYTRELLFKLGINR